MARPQNVVGFVGKATQTFHKKTYNINTNHRHKMQKVTSICNLKELFYLKDFIRTEAVSQKCAVEKVFLEILQNSQENTCARGVSC